VPAEYARAAFDAWRHGEGAALVDLSDPEVAQLLLARDVREDESWAADPTRCEGAAGSTYCTWTSTEAQLTLRVGNEAAAAGAPHAVSEAAFATAEGRVAVWPLTTGEEAGNTQDQVDDGHSPWMLEPEAVVASYAGAELGFAEPVVEEVALTFFHYRVADATTGIAVDVQLVQPARPGPGGIWAVARVASLPAADVPTPI
jgi:hypothetical protein